MDLEEVIINIKSKVISPQSPRPEDFLFEDIQTILSWGEEAVERLYFNSATYQNNIELMSSSKPILDIDHEELDEYQICQEQRLFKYWKDFLYITKTYRTFPSKDGLQYFTNDYKRSLHGFNVVSSIRFGIGILIKVYGHGKSIQPMEKLLVIKSLIMKFEQCFSI